MSRPLAVCIALLAPLGAVVSLHATGTAPVPFATGSAAARQVPGVAPGQPVPEAGQPRDGTFAVLPFTNISRNVEDDWLGDGIAETVAADLAASPSVVVIARNRLDEAVNAGFATTDTVARAVTMAMAVICTQVATGTPHR